MRRSIAEIRQVVDDLDYDFSQFDIVNFVQHIEALRQRKIVLQEFHVADGITGVWIPRNELDFLIYTPKTHPIHQTHIILHEIAHMLLKHRLSDLTQVLGDLLSVEPSPEGRLRTANVNPMNDDDEWEAEQFVLVIRNYIFRWDRWKELLKPLSSNEKLAYFSDSIFFDERQISK